MKHDGKSLHRLSTNPLEKAYHDAWLKENDENSPASPTLPYLLGDGNKPGVVSDRDALVAATVIQWLGSPVGQRFVDDVLAQRKADDLVTEKKHE